MRMPTEKLLEDFIVEHWEEVFRDRFEYVDRQVRCGQVGILDILARHRDGGDFVVIELKKDSADDVVFGQLARYMGWVKENIAKPAGRNVHGIIVASTISPKLRAAASSNPAVELLSFDLDLRLRLNSAGCPRCRCGTPFREGAEFCSLCGGDRSTEWFESAGTEIRCTCGQRNPPGAGFCRRCGKPLIRPGTSEASTAKWTTTPTESLGEQPSLVFDSQIPADTVRCQLDLARDAVNQAVAEMSTLNGGSGLSEKIRVDLRRSGHQWVRITTVQQLSKWCHPKRWAEREKRMRPVARNVSCLLFGFVVARMLEPEAHLGGPVNTKALRGVTSEGFSILGGLLKFFLTSKVGIVVLILGIALLWDVSTTSLEERMTQEILGSGSGTVPQSMIFDNKFHPEATLTRTHIKNESSSVWFDLAFRHRNGNLLGDLDRLNPGESAATYGAFSVTFKGATRSGDIVRGYKDRTRNPD